MTKLFSYVVDHDYGFAPNPFRGYCTLARCKFGKKRKNIVELAEKGDWFVGTGGANTKLSAGHGKLIYAMRVDEKLTFADYFNDERFIGREDNLLDGANRTDKFALISQHYFYFGRNAIDIEKIPKNHLEHSLEKRGPAHRNDFNKEFIEEFTRWLERHYEVGVHGMPCASGKISLVSVRVKNPCG
jgi:hypothetical protein